MQPIQPEKTAPAVLVYRGRKRIGPRDAQKKQKEEQFEQLEMFFAQLRSARTPIAPLA